MAVVNVNLGDRSYPITISPGCLANIGGLLRNIEPEAKILIVSDDHVAALYGQRVLASLKKAGYHAEIFQIRPGEASKTIEVAMSVYTKAIEWGMDRKSSFLALGGGVVGDLTGFVAATYLRGVPFIQVPTSLLAQVDSSVGGKVAVDHPLGKNLIGAFYQPQAVVIDPELLRTLPEREYYAGLAEVIKYGAIADKEFFTRLLVEQEAILARNPVVLGEIIRRSCQIKADIVEKDEKDTSLRMILNFGHTIAHALEAGFGFERYNHGEAVAIGMVGAALLSHRMGFCSSDVVAALRDCLIRFHLPTNVVGGTGIDYRCYMERDKKNIGGETQWILLLDIGQTTICNAVSEAMLQDIMAEIMLSADA
ncbi:MAG: 3-dehydroquinate synthase [Negativicutes bacterium]